MNGIIIPKKTLTPIQVKKLKASIHEHGSAKIWCQTNGVSFPSMKKARDGKELSVYLIDKIIATF